MAVQSGLGHLGVYACYLRFSSVSHRLILCSPTLERAQEFKLTAAINPQVKRIVDENMNTLRQPRAKEVSEKIRQAVMSGSTGELERYVKDIGKKTLQQSSGSLSNWLSRFPDGSGILPQLVVLKEATETRGGLGQVAPEVAPLKSRRWPGGTEEGV